MNQGVAPLIPNVGNNEAAIAGSSGAIFSAQDRKIMKEIGAEKTKRSFREIFAKKPLNGKVDYEEVTLRAKEIAKDLSREKDRNDHQQLLKRAIMSKPKERVKLSQEAQDQATVPVDKHVPSAKEKELHEKTIALVKELKLNADDLIGKFALNQEELLRLIYRIKDLHLKRLLTDSQNDFVRLSKQIKIETLAAAKPEEKNSLTGQLNQLTSDAAHYKLRLLESIQAIDYQAEQEKNIKWLKSVIAHHSRQS